MRCLTIRRKALDADHPEVASTLNSLAIVYHRAGQFERAEPLFLRCLEIQEAKLGETHPDVADTLNNLALTYDTMNRGDEARRFNERCLKIRLAQLGPEHPRVAATYSNIADMYFKDGDFSQAEPLYRKSLAIREAKLSAEHHDCIDNLDDLAVLHMQTGKDDLAAKEFDRERRAMRKHVAQLLPMLGTQEQLVFMKDNEWYLHRALTFGMLQAAKPALSELSAGWVLNGKSVVETSLAERAFWPAVTTIQSCAVKSRS